MSYEAETIANVFLRFAREDGRGVSHMKIQKLLYFAQGHAMSLLDAELISDNCQAWDYGPVYPNVYRHLKKYGASAVRSEIVDEADAERFDPAQATAVKPFLRVVWNKYGELDALRLSELSHVTKGPWARTRRANNANYRAVIEKTLIQEYFNGLSSRVE
ncbi:DUF4065 domain-containing protein [Stenotrophomonas aracearum]|jgi:uncharacterized phage-associated protein|uniref:DUF4065 domain-containing protein n=1 Tax=Stenotrophomonas aracearum TaxID=3003272 RepID=A0ABY9YBR8_9GAMM|nr:type II toxin-antitoxin system antitoxin SocA domain-containing protein [Stenotrophomonas sp. A5588]WNH48295.1 DUF4065 domain-containing protein [Stenotrophomonas sp. A5588]